MVGHQVLVLSIGVRVPVPQYESTKAVALVCDDQLYVKILPASTELEDLCEKGEPYPSARLHYVVEESQLSQMDSLPHILLDIAKVLPARKKKGKKR